jgi:hypothetical protein
MSFDHLKVGDNVTRLMGGSLRMKMVVREIKEDLLVCDCIDRDTGKIVHGGWTFDRNSGVEEDADLKWGVKFGVTGSVLVKDN